MKRWENSDEIDRYVEDRTKQFKKDELFHSLEEKALAASPCQ